MSRKRTADEKRAAIGARRLQLVNQWLALRQSGLSGNAAARVMGLHRLTLRRWSILKEQGGAPALIPRTALCGRHSLLETLRVSKSVLNQVRRLSVALQSNIKAWRAFARSRACPRALAAAVLDCRPDSLPHSLHQATRLHRSKIRVLHTGHFFTVLPPVRRTAAKARAKC